MEMFKKWILIIPVLLHAVPLLAQERLTVDDAIAIALENNFDVRIAKKQAELSATNNTLGMAGYLPTLAVDARRNFEINETRQEFFTGEVREGSNVKNNFLNGAAVLDWTLFSGFAVQTTRDQLKAFEEIGDVAALVQMESTATAVITAYYDVYQKQKQLEAIENSIDISSERKYLADQRVSIGTGSGLTFYQASVDLNTDSANLVRQEFLVMESKAILNQLLARAPNTAFDVVENFELQEDLVFGELLDKVKAQNRDLMLARRGLDVAELDLKLSKAEMYPEIGFVSSYNYARSESEIGFLQSNLTTGLTYGLTARINIFDGMNNRTRNQMAQITIEQNKYNVDQTALQLENDLFKAFAAYEMARKLSKLERDNVKVAKQTLDIAKEQMRLGSITAIELRQAQVNLVNAEFRQIQTDYELKLAETELIRLSGDLIIRE